MTDASIPPATCALLVMCVDCGQGLELPLPIDRDTFPRLLAQHGWFVAVLTPPSPPGQEPQTPVVLGALCGSCAPKVYPPEVLQKIAEQQRLWLTTGQEKTR